MNSDPELGRSKSCWLDVTALARVEATSEDSRYPIKSAFEEDGHGWRAVEVGEQTIKLVFDEPRRIQRAWLCFIEPDTDLSARARRTSRTPSAARAISAS